MYVPCPLMDPHPEEEWPSGTPKQKRTLREMPKTTLQNPLSLMWRHGWNGRPNSWAPHLVDGTPSHSGYKSPQKLAQKIRASFYIPEVRMRTLLKPGYTVPSLQGVLTEMPSYQMTYPIKTCGTNQLSWWLFMAGVFNTGQRNKVLLRSQNLCILGESVIELWEVVKEYVTFNYRDIIQDLGVTHDVSPTHEPHTTIFSHVLLSPSEGQVRGATTYAASTVAERDMVEYTASPARTERENPCLLFVTCSVAQLNLGPGVDAARRSTTEGNVFWNL